MLLLLGGCKVPMHPPGKILLLKAIQWVKNLHVGDNDRHVGPIMLIKDTNLDFNSDSIDSDNYSFSTLLPQCSRVLDGLQQGELPAQVARGTHHNSSAQVADTVTFSSSWSRRCSRHHTTLNTILA